MPQKWVYALVVTPSFPTRHNVPIILRVHASSEEESIEKAKSQYPGPVIIHSTRRVKTLEDNCLDILWEAHSDIYLELWEPDITTKQMLKRLKEKYPVLYEGFMGW